MIVVVPPQAAARVPVSKVSEASVPPNGSSMWVWASMPPGITYLPVASITVSTFAARSTPSSAEPGDSTAAIVSPSTSTSAVAVPVALTTVPPVIKQWSHGRPLRAPEPVERLRVPEPVRTGSAANMLCVPPGFVRAQGGVG